jgi:hypothetical protein
MLKAGVQARHEQRQAYAVCRDAVERLLSATAGQQDIVSDLKARLDNMVRYGEDEKFEEHTLSSLKAYSPDPSDSMAGDGWIRRGGACLMTGGTGVGKSVLVSQLAVCLSAGTPFLGIPVHRPSRVLYVQSENDAVTMQRDILSIVSNLAPSPDEATVDANLSIIHAYGLAGEAFHSWLAAKVRRHAPDAVIIDNYQAYVEEQDINSSEAALSWIRPLDRMAKQSKFALVVVCHTTKPQDRKTWTARESVYMAAGSSALANWARTSCELTQNGDDGRYRLRFGKNAERNGLQDDNGGIVRDVYVEHSGDRNTPYWVKSALQMPTDGKYDGAIINLKAAQPELSMREVARMAGCGKSHVQRVLARMQDYRPIDCPNPGKKDESHPSAQLSRPDYRSGTGGQLRAECCPGTAMGQMGQSEGTAPLDAATDGFLDDDIGALAGASEGDTR